jgi:hypothetical protein
MFYENESQYHFIRREPQIERFQRGGCCGEGS